MRLLHFAIRTARRTPSPASECPTHP